LALALAATGSALAASINGVWVGKPRLVQEPQIPISAYPPVKLVVSARTLTVHVTGRTSAAHDGDAVSTCDQRYAYKETLAGWRVYLQIGSVKITGAVSGGAPEFSFCGQPKGAVIRVRPAGAKLKVEYSVLIRPDDPFVPVMRAYLHH
jgi:hypothetical protein